LTTKYILSISILLSLTFSLKSFSQTEKYADITNKEINLFLNNLKKNRDFKFKKFALTNFVNGTKIDFKKLKIKNKNFVGIGQNFNENKSDTSNSFKLCGLCYLDKGEGDYHKNIYFENSYGNFFGSFFVIPYTVEEVKSIDVAIETLTDLDSIPESNNAFKYALSHKIENDKLYKNYETNDSSLMQIGNPNVYFRKYGNLIIQIDVKSNNSNSYEKNKIEKFVSFIGVYLINENLKKSFNKFVLTR
jgi:hypothetical protein